jgi:hypothetical protein
MWMRCLLIRDSLGRGSSIAARLILVVLLFVANPAWGFDHSHAAWDALLKKHVVLLDGGKASRLRYAAMAQDRTELKSYLAMLSALPEKEFQAWTREQKMAFLINAYNAFTVEKILTRYPDIRSIWDFGRIFGNPFKDGFFSLLGRQSSLDVVGHELLRPVFKDARVHYAVNCASISCPMLREEAYVPARLDRQLDEQTVRFFCQRSSNGSRRTSSRKRVTLRAMPRCCPTNRNIGASSCKAMCRSYFWITTGPSTRLRTLFQPACRDVSRSLRYRERND